MTDLLVVGKYLMSRADSIGIFSDSQANFTYAEEPADSLKLDIKNIDREDLERSDEEGIPSPKNADLQNDDHLQDLLARIQEHRAEEGDADMSIDLDNPKEPSVAPERGPEPDSPPSKDDKPAKKGKEDSAPPTAVSTDDEGR